MQLDTKMKNLKLIMALLCVTSVMLSGCDDSKKQDAATKKEQSTVQATNPDVLPYLNMKEDKADYALPFCEKKNCIEIDIQTVKTQDAWLNQWIATNQANVIQQQIDLKQSMTLQQAVDAYIKQSDSWQDEFAKNQPYELRLGTRIASQRNQYVLLQLSVNSTQKDITVKERQYFYVADRKLKKKLSILDVIIPAQQTTLNQWIQQHYQQWLEKQDKSVQKSAPKKLFWGQSDWFFDGEGVGLHYRSDEITPDADQLDIYLNKHQTQQILQPEVFQKMF